MTQISGLDATLTSSKNILLNSAPAINEQTIKREVHAEALRNEYFGLEYFHYEHYTTLHIKVNT